MMRGLTVAFILLTHTAIASPAVLPDAASPGAISTTVTQDNIDQTICQKDWSKTVRPNSSFTSRIKKQMMQEQQPGVASHEFELDHRVPIEDGGCPTCVTNLWLQPWRDPQHHVCQPDVLMDAACKDRLEDFVHRQICHGEMTLDQGEKIFLGDWIAEYNTVFHK